MSAEEHYLDAIESEEAGDLEAALKHAKAAVKADPEHTNAWWMVSNLETPGGVPDLGQVSRSLNACKKVVELEPGRVDAWIRGGRLMVDHLGLHEDALHWWQSCREIAPEESVPIVEQTTILTEMGFYEEGMACLGTLFSENLDIGTSQLAKITQLHKTLEKAAMQDKNSHFRPWEKNNPGWTAIKMRCHKGPVSENMLFMLTTVPFLMAEVFVSRAIFGEGWTGFCLTSLLILVTVMFGMGFTRKLYHKVNRPAFNLLRAIQLEASTGKLVIPEDIRGTKLYMFLLSRHPLAFQQRYELIIKSGKTLPRNWKVSLPDFESHLDDIGYIEEEEDSELSSYEEE